jgi:hypothetical protein
MPITNVPNAWLVWRRLEGPYPGTWVYYRQIFKRIFGTGFRNIILTSSPSAPVAPQPLGFWYMTTGYQLTSTLGAPVATMRARAFITIEPP